MVSTPPLLPDSQPVMGREGDLISFLVRQDTAATAVVVQSLSWRTSPWKVWQWVRKVEMWESCCLEDLFTAEAECLGQGRWVGMIPWQAAQMYPPLSNICCLGYQWSHRLSLRDFPRKVAHKGCRRLVDETAEKGNVDIVVVVLQQLKSLHCQLYYGKLSRGGKLTLAPPPKVLHCPSVDSVGSQRTAGGSVLSKDSHCFFK